MNMINSPSNRGRYRPMAYCDCCNFVHDSKTAAISKRSIRRKEKIIWRKDWNIK